MNDLEAIQKKLTEPACLPAGRLDVKLDLLTKRTLAYVTTILQILHNQGVVGFREMLHSGRCPEQARGIWSSTSPNAFPAGRHWDWWPSVARSLDYLNQNEKDFSKTPTSVDREFIRIMKPLWLDPEWGNGPLTD